ncbi:sugar phosphorylase [Candidatus Woesearchaeota archaeon]|nr:sugar phosphorylase [Candidatus Woesearchaeota archaeon]
MEQFDFLKEAERFYKLITKIRFPGAEPEKKPPKKRVRLTYNNKKKSMLSKLSYLYGEKSAKETYDKIEGKIRDFRSKKPRWLNYRDAHFNPVDRFTEKDSVLIVYPDMLRDKNRLPLQVLLEFSREHLAHSINTIHLLPFYPYSSDRGFSVVNYKKVKKDLGSWKDIKGFRGDFNLMFDCVFNHISTQSLWFRSFLKGSQLYDNHFIAFDTRNEALEKDLKKVTRPRSSELLTRFKTNSGFKYVWTTFGSDQVDLNFKEPVVLLRIIDIMLLYIRNGAGLIRLDAIAYSWKEIGTNSIYLRQSHAIVQLLRDILDLLAPSVSIITETNVTHAQNIKYFGNSRNEAQMVYNFSLPPLVLYTFYSGNARYLSRWASRLDNPSDYCTYFNFLASHDGIGLMPLKRILPYKEVKSLVKTAKRNGGLVSYKTNNNSKQEPYELNITWWDALNNNHRKEDKRLMKRRYLASVAVALVIQGVPGIYFHSLFATRNDARAVEKSRVNRDINRKNVTLSAVEKELADRKSVVRKVFRNYTEFIRVRSRHKAFHPNAGQRILIENNSVFSVLRTSLDKKEKILSLINVTDELQEYRVDVDELGLNRCRLYNIISNRRVIWNNPCHQVNEFTVILKPYEVCWIRSRE